MSHVILGIDQLSASKLRAKRIGILCHPSSATRQFSHLEDILDAKITKIFGPQHGIHGETQDNMIEWQDTRDEKGRPIYSLYGERRIPTLDQLRDLDLMVIDLMDVGARYYTFIYTMSYMLERCAEIDLPVLICDRPNPLSGERIEGPLLNMNYRSFVGLHRLPVCHGMSIGELALLFAETMEKRPDIRILKMKSWKRKMHWPETGLTWTLPSPNMPSFGAAMFYPGGCLLEGTSLSEGRGTTRPFELIGAPFIDWIKVEAEYRRLCKALKLPMVVAFHRQGFIPTFHKYKGEICFGALQVCLKNQTFMPLRHTTLILWILRKLYPSLWTWKQPPYEYEYEKLPIDILAGGPDLREHIDRQLPLKDLFSNWKEDEIAFRKLRRPFLLYK